MAENNEPRPDSYSSWDSMCVSRGGGGRVTGLVRRSLGTK